jgi:hypothetical protein
MKILAALRHEEQVLLRQAQLIEHELAQIRTAAKALSGKVGRKVASKHRKMSKAGRLAISRASKARWAKWRASKKAA